MYLEHFFRRSGRAARLIYHRFFQGVGGVGAYLPADYHLRSPAADHLYPGRFGDRVCAVAIIKGHNQPRLEGVIGGIYSNPNDLAFAVVLTLPFALAFLVTSKNAVQSIFGSAECSS